MLGLPTGRSGCWVLPAPAETKDMPLGLPLSWLEWDFQDNIGITMVTSALRKRDTTLFPFLKFGDVIFVIIKVEKGPKAHK